MLFEQFYLEIFEIFSLETHGEDLRKDTLKLQRHKPWSSQPRRQVCVAQPKKWPFCDPLGSEILGIFDTMS